MKEESRLFFIMKLEDIQKKKIIFLFSQVQCFDAFRQRIFCIRIQDILLPEWKEIDFGRFEGKNYQDLNGDPDYQRWIDSGGVTAFPGGESRDEFVKRSMAGLEWCIECMEDYKQKSAVCIVHGGTIMAIMSSLTGGDYYDYQVKNGQGYEIELSIKNNNVQLEKLTPIAMEEAEEKDK